MRRCVLPLVLPLLLSVVLCVPARAQTRTSSWDAARQRMVRQAVVESGVRNPRVIEAMRRTPRHEFVPQGSRHLAYEDMGVPIGEGQTISSPFIVAFMTEALDPQPTDRVLEIGTGSGYQAAVLSGLVQEVYTIEIVESLAQTAARTLAKLDYNNVHTRIGDGYQGWPEKAPFDKIIVTCSPENVPQPLQDQLREGGLMVIPVGQRYQQTLCVMRKRDGQLQQEALRPTLFVPMTGTAEAQRKVLPDPLHPALSNAGFEQPPLDTGFVPDWYYQRQARQVQDPQAPEGSHYLQLENTVQGKPALAMQGFPVDGREVNQLELSAWVRCANIRRGQNAEQQAAIVVMFYNEGRAPLTAEGTHWLGPFLGSSPWQRHSAFVRVPPDAREAIVRLGLFGAVGQLDVDDVNVKRRAASPEDVTP